MDSKELVKLSIVSSVTTVISVISVLYYNTKQKLKDAMIIIDENNNNLNKEQLHSSTLATIISELKDKNTENREKLIHTENIISVTQQKYEDIVYKYNGLKKNYAVYVDYYKKHTYIKSSSKSKNGKTKQHAKISYPDTSRGDSISSQLSQSQCTY